MSTIGSLFVNLKARTASFDSKMKRSSKGVKGLEKGLSDMKGFALKAGAALGVYLGARAMKSFISNPMESIDVVGKLSERIGIATEDILKLRFAAELTGAGAATMDKSLENMTRRLGEASRGSGEAVQGLDMLGLSVADLIKQSPAESFADIADSIKGLSTPAEKAAAAYKIFGRQGVGLVNTLNLGAEGLAKVGAEAEKMGGIFSNLDYAKVAAANDALGKMGKVIKGIGIDVAIELSPYIEAAANKFISMATNGRTMGGIVVDAVEGIAKGIDRLIGLTDELEVGWLGVKLVIIDTARTAAIVTAQTAMAGLEKMGPLKFTGLGLGLAKGAEVSLGLAASLTEPLEIATENFEKGMQGAPR